MGKRAHMAIRLMAVFALAAVMGGCGYRELKAPCGPEDGRPAAALSLIPVEDHRMTGSPLDRLGVGPIPVTDPCGPLRPLNSPQLTGARLTSASLVGGDP